MNDKDKQPTSGFVSDIGDESDFNSTRHNGGFTNISEAYVSKSGFTRMFSAVRYGKRYMLKCLKPDFAYTRTISMEPVGELGDCIVMEYVDGETLEAAVKGGNMMEDKVRKIASQLLDAMEYMHAKQTVHRDIKPSNIMLTHRGGDVKLIDFGLSDSETFCVLKIPAGTIGYMAPEQLQPGAKSDPCADIYSFGKVLEYMAEAAHCKSLARVGQKCAADECDRRPADIAQVRRLMTGKGGSLAVVNAVLVVLALVLLVVIGVMMSSRQTAPTGTPPTDSASVGATNKVVDSSLW